MGGQSNEVECVRKILKREMWERVKTEESMDKHKRPMNQKSLLFETLYVLKKRVHLNSLFVEFVHFHATKKGGLSMISLNFHIFLNSTLKYVELKINKLCKSCELLMPDRNFRKVLEDVWKLS